MAPSNRTFDNKFLDNVHYVTWGMKDAACKSATLVQSSAFLSSVTCKKCRNSKVFKEHTILKEVGCNGNFTEFYEALKERVVLD